MEEKTKSQNRLAVLQKIEDYEAKGLFDLDVEEDPLWEKLDPNKIDFLKDKLSSKMKAYFANRIGNNFYRKSMQKKEVIFSGVTGLEHLHGYQGGAIVTCNHCHRFDNFAVYLGLKKHFKKFRLYKIVREGNYSFPGKVGIILRNCDTLPIGASHALTSKCLDAVGVLLAKNKKILIYPEQGMWWNYRKPRPLKRGAFLFAAKFEAPILPCFITLKDSNIIGSDGFPVQEFTLNILPMIHPDKSLSVKENCKKMQEANFQLWKDTYERVYGIPLHYLCTDLNLSQNPSRSSEVTV